MSYTPPASAFVDNSAPVGGGVGPSLSAAFLNALIAGVDEADNRLTVLETQAVNIRSYGAAGDGAADDTVPLTSALATGRHVFLPPGSYKIATPVAMTITGQTLYGSGANTILIKQTGAGQDCLRPQADRITIADIAFQSTESGWMVNANGNYGPEGQLTGIELRRLSATLTSANAQGLMVGHTDQVVIEGCDLTAKSATADTSFGIVVESHLRETFDASVRNNRVVGFGDGIKSYGTTPGMRYRMIIQGNTVTGAKRFGIDAYHAAQSRIVANHVENCGSFGIWADSSLGSEGFGHGNVVAANFVANCAGFGILTEEFTGGAITGNTVHGCLHGIVLGGGTYSTTVSGNACTHNTLNGIWADKDQNPNPFPIGNLAVTGNICRHNGRDGIRLGGLQRSNVVSGNLCDDNGVEAPSLYAGIYIGPDAAGVIGRVHSINGNSCTNGGSTGTSTNTGGAGQQAYGVFLDGQAASLLEHASVVGNYFEGNTLAHINNVRTLTVHVADNYFKTGTGIASTGTSTVSYGINNGPGSPTGSASKKIVFGTEDGVRLLKGTGIPEAVVTAPVGSEYIRTDGGALTCRYVKESGTGNTGWVGK